MVWNVVDTRFFDYTNDENPDAVFSEKKLLTLVERIQDAFTRQEELYHECRDYRIWKYGEDVGG